MINWWWSQSKYCNKTDFVSRYCVLIRHLTLEHMISFHFHVMNWFLETVQEIIEYYILNLIFELDNECFIWIWLLNLIIKNAFEFDYMFNFYHMQCIRIKVISSIDFLSCTMSCILWRHHNLAFNRIFFLKLSWSLFVFSHYIAFFFHYSSCLSWHHAHHEYHNLDFQSCSNSVHYNKRILNRDYQIQNLTDIYFYLLNWW